MKNSNEKFIFKKSSVSWNILKFFHTHKKTTVSVSDLCKNTSEKNDRE